MTDTLEATTYGAMNLLEEAFGKHGAEKTVEFIEAWLNEEDQDCPDYRETMAQGVIDAINNAGAINHGKAILTIVYGDASMVRFEWDPEDKPSEVFDQTMMKAIDAAMKPS